MRIDSAAAILAPGRRPLSYGELHRQVEQVAASLNKLGISRNDRVAMVLPAGPEAAVALIAVPAGATGAPLNPAYSTTQFDHYLANLDPSALLVYEGSESPAVDVAHCRNIPVLELARKHPGRQACLHWAVKPGTNRSLRVLPKPTIRRCCCTPRAQVESPSLYH